MIQELENKYNSLKSYTVAIESHYKSKKREFTDTIFEMNEKLQEFERNCKKVTETIQQLEKKNQSNKGMNSTPKFEKFFTIPIIDQNNNEDFINSFRKLKISDTLLTTSSPALA